MNKIELGKYKFDIVTFTIAISKIQFAKDKNELAQALGIRSNDYNTVLYWFIKKGFITNINGEKLKIKKKK